MSILLIDCSKLFDENYFLVIKLLRVNKNFVIRFFFASSIKNHLNFQEFWDGYCNLLKNEGRGDTQNHPEIPQTSWGKIMEFLLLLQDLMETDKASHRYQEIIMKLPEEFCDRYNYLLQW